MLSVVPAKAGTHNPGRRGCGRYYAQRARTRHHAVWVPAFAGTTGGEAQALHQQIAEIAPFEVLALDQHDLPVTFPSLQLFLAGDRFFGAVIGLDVDEAVNAIRFDKLGAFAVSMLLQPLPQGIGDPDIQGTMTPAREDVDVIHTRNAREC